MADFEDGEAADDRWRPDDRRGSLPGGRDSSPSRSDHGRKRLRDEGRGGRDDRERYGKEERDGRTRDDDGRRERSSRDYGRGGGSAHGDSREERGDSRRLHSTADRDFGGRGGRHSDDVSYDSRGGSRHHPDGGGRREHRDQAYRPDDGMQRGDVGGDDAGGTLRRRDSSGSGRPASPPQPRPAAAAAPAPSSMSSLLAGRLPPRVKLPPSLRAELTRAASSASAGGAADGAVQPSARAPVDSAPAPAASVTDAPAAAEAPPRRRYESPVSDDERRADSPPIPVAVAPGAAGAADAAAGSLDSDADDGAPGGSDGEGALPAAVAAPSRARSRQLSAQALLQGCRNVNAYRPIGKIDEGTYGVVFAAEDVETGERVALKKVKMPKLTDFPITALRETNVLLALDHDNIVRVREMVVGAGIDKVYMVMDFYDHDLKMLMDALPQNFSQGEVKRLMLQLLRGVAHMHAHWVIHRDLKTSNLLYGPGGHLCICDFGLARKYGSPLRPYTANVVTLWYRAPELLLEAPLYGPALDMWSVGCIFGELVTKRPLLDGHSELEQLDRIFRLLGTPTAESWPGWSSLKGARELRMKPRPPAPLRAALSLGLTPFGGAPFLSDLGLDLLRRCLELDPARRISAAEALRHPWFEESPAPTDPRLMPSVPARRQVAAAAAGPGA